MIKMNEKEKQIIEALQSINAHIEGSNDFESLLNIQIEALIKYIETEDDKQLKLATDWDKAWDAYGR